MTDGGWGARPNPTGWSDAADPQPPLPPSPPPSAQRFGPPPGWQGGALAGLVCAVAMVAAGFPLGLLWAAAAPHLDVASALRGNESAFAAQSDIDARFGLICAVAGLVGGLLAFWRARDAGWQVPVGLAAGGVGGALIAGWIGHLRRSPGVRHSLPADASPVLVDLLDLRVRSHGLYLIPSVVALTVFALALWMTTWRRAEATTATVPAPYDAGTIPAPYDGGACPPPGGTRLATPPPPYGDGPPPSHGTTGPPPRTAPPPARSPQHGAPPRSGEDPGPARGSQTVDDGGEPGSVRAGVDPA